MKLFKEVTNYDITEKRPAPAFYFLITGILFLSILFFVSFNIVGVGQVGIVTQFGRIAGEKQSGAFFTTPWQGVTIMNIQVQKEQQDASAATKDLQTVTATLALNYHLTASTAFDVYKNIGTDYKGRIIDPVLQETVKSVTSQYNADELISQRPAVEANALQELQTKLGARGISVDNVSIVNFNFSKAFDDAIEQKQVAQQNAQKAQYELQSAQLQAQAQDVQAKTLTPEYLELQAIQKWNGQMPSAIGSGTIFNIPLQGSK